VNSPWLLRINIEYLFREVIGGVRGAAAEGVRIQEPGGKGDDLWKEFRIRKDRSLIGVGLMGNGPQALKRIAVQEKFRWVDALKGHSKVAQGNALGF
jgi:hypothetical protein